MEEDKFEQQLLKWTKDENVYVFHADFYGKYYFKIDERLYYIDLRCGKEDNVKNIFCRMFTHFKTGELFYEDINRELSKSEGDMLTSQQLRDACENFVKENGEKIEERIKKLENGRRLLNDTEWDALQVGSYKGDARYWPWEFVDKCGREFKTERFLLMSQFCYNCGAPVIKSKFRTSESSWENLAGREGWIFFCPKCQKQLQENITCMN